MLKFALRMKRGSDIEIMWHKLFRGITLARGDDGKAVINSITDETFLKTNISDAEDSPIDQN